MKDRTKKQYINGTQRVLDLSKKENSPYEVEILGKNFTVLPNVFSPKYFYDTAAFAKHLQINSGDEVLEIGPGTGVISIAAAQKGASKVLAVDINPDAVKNTQLNIDKHNLGSSVEVRQGDLYSPLKVEEKFDVIFWNVPFGFVEEGNIPDLEKAVYDPGYRSIEKFIKEADEHLKQDGKLYIGFSSTMGDMELLEKFCEETGKKLVTIYEEESTETYPVKFEIFEAVKK